jgi:hypothetical protein
MLFNWSTKSQINLEEQQQNRIALAVFPARCGTLGESFLKLKSDQGHPEPQEWENFNLYEFSCFGPRVEFMEQIRVGQGVGKQVGSGPKTNSRRPEGLTNQSHFTMQS